LVAPVQENQNGNDGRRPNCTMKNIRAGKGQKRGGGGGDRTHISEEVQKGGKWVGSGVRRKWGTQPRKGAPKHTKRAFHQVTKSKPVKKESKNGGAQSADGR